MRDLLLLSLALGVALADPRVNPRMPRALGDLLTGDRTFVDPKGNESCVCVPFYQCEDGNVITDGVDLLDIRFGPKRKCENFNICCNVPPEMMKKIEAKPGVEKGVMTSISDGIKEIFGGGGSGSSGSNVVDTGHECACVAFYLCDGGVLAPDTALKIDRRQISNTGRCSNTNEKCCAFPKTPAQPATPPPSCTCTGRQFCNQQDIVPQLLGSTQPACGPNEVCCTKPLPTPAGGSGTHGSAGVVPDTQRPDYDVWQFCKSYPFSVACVHSRQINGRPTLKESASFNPDVDAGRLNEAIGYFDADDDVLVDILTKRTFAQRALISQAYERNYQKSLLTRVERTTRGNFEDLMMALVKAPTYYEYLAKELHDSMDRLGTDEDTVLETLISSTNDEIDIIKPLYYNIEGDTLLDDIKSDFSGDLEDILVALVNNSRDNSFTVSKSRARDQANALYRAGEGGLLGLGTDENTFKYYLTHENYPQLALIFAEYEQISGEAFTEALEDEFSRHMEDAVLAIVEVTRNLPRYFAQRLHHALWGRGPLGKDDSSLIRIIVSRAEIDLATIMFEYKAKYGRELTRDIELKATGDYEDALLALCGGTDQSSWY